MTAPTGASRPPPASSPGAAGTPPPDAGGGRWLRLLRHFVYDERRAQRFVDDEAQVRLAERCERVGVYGMGLSVGLGLHRQRTCV